MNDVNIIFDSNYVCYVHKFALSQGLTYRGGRTEIIFGFLKTIFDMAERFESSKFFFCWDSRESFRRQIYPEYKINRRREDRTEEEKRQDRIAYHQFDLIREKVLKSLGFANIFQVEGYESDDIIASLVKNNFPEETNVVISSDNDLLQLLENCSLYNISKRSLTTKDEFTRNYGISPEEWGKVKSIAGCSTDNVSGVYGVGEKTAAKYLSGKMKEGKIKQRIESEEGIKILENNSALVVLPFPGIPIFDVSEKDSFSLDKFIRVFEKYGFESLSQEKRIKSIKKIFLNA
jgi:DNA polymerase-1